ncbi:TPA: hypothetical protein RNS99_000480 [Stenotrophomonas maltophilia]|uniref:hypothetical protein n=1 Tax=Stenotrophomonas maltophilia TaxID=40324 RepID=UPI00066CDD23|nr:hypothetical protein [Stenotrophomonas maltophilia]MDH2061527.1 hypothetical protein [Stenotrophomonas maltophilia]HDX0898602.1 hypothetical protein [Stenotrophomonas maltophilia]HDX0916269.1 hypothetical protein [Stenotrophomonas maltophilia]HEL3010195.1 hypothetical protein [Stenotrophomonas maltophilia]HEL4140495.1 hypothetical protein [Stenotrophomonas maltophilia]
MTAEITEILDRLQTCEAGLEMHRGYLKAMEYALRICILTHPEPERLTENWLRLLPSMAAKHREDGGDLFAAAFQQSLTVLTEQIGAGNTPP